jgi:hypothetical protein
VSQTHLMTPDADDPMARSGARWCPEHSRWECSANKPDHHASAVRGMAKCRHHVGKQLDLAKTQGEANLAAWSAVAGREQEPLDLGQTVMEQLRVAVIRADIYGELLRIQISDEEIGGLVGPSYAAGRDGQRVETGEQVRALVKLEAEWRDRVVKYAEVAHRMGIATRVIELAQGQAEIVVLAFRAALEVAGAELLPGVRAAMVETFLGRLGAGDQPLELGARGGS